MVLTDWRSCLTVGIPVLLVGLLLTFWLSGFLKTAVTVASHGCFAAALERHVSRARAEARRKVQEQRLAEMSKTSGTFVPVGRMNAVTGFSVGPRVGCMVLGQGWVGLREGCQGSGRLV